jgi:predicted amidophosphoribosyltransferase
MDDEFGESDEHNWTDDDSAAETVPCPACGADIYEEAEQCPVCGEYVVHNSSALAGKPGWYLLLAVLGVIAVIASLSGLMRLM